MDPILALLGRLALALLFAGAAYHKAQDLPRFTAILADYRLLPQRLTPAVARLFVGIEIGLAFGLLLPAEALSLAAPLVAASLLTIYSLAIAVNLARGRNEIDCGCGGDADQMLRPGLLARNALLIVVALASALPAAERELSFVDGITLTFGLASLALMWRAAGQLASIPVLSSTAIPLFTRITHRTHRRRTAP